MTACRWASPRVAEVALASAAVIRAFPAARCVLSVEHANDSGTVDVVDVLLVVEGDVLELVEDDEEEDDDEDEEERELLDDDDDDDDERELLDDDEEDGEAGGESGPAHGEVGRAGEVRRGAHRH